MNKLYLSVALGAVMSMTASAYAADASNMSPAHKKFMDEAAKGNSTFQHNGVRTLGDYSVQEADYFNYLFKNHPVFKYEKEGNLIGKYAIQDRGHEFSEINGGPTMEKEITGFPTSVTYRLGVETILDFPNKFVGPEKCGECHVAQYQKWQRSRHAKTVRFPGDHEEVNNDYKKNLYGSEASVLPAGITEDVVYAIIGSPRTKYGFIDAWLVRGTYHVRDGLLQDGTGKIVAGANQFSRGWAEWLTPEVAKKIRKDWIPTFPTTMEEFGGSGSDRWGMTSYGATFEKKFRFQPATAYCEVCHTFKFDFQNSEEFYAALGNSKELQKHTVSLGITCEECHGAGGHLYGGKGGGMPSNCERCHQRFLINDNDIKSAKAKGTDVPFGAYFKSACPSCGTEGSQMYSSAHYDKGMRCSTCHDPHEVTSNDWKSGVTKTSIKKECKSCHATQQEFFDQGGTHAKNSCTSCHMPNMGSCENFASIQFPDYAGFDNVRASHIWKIKVDKTAKTLNPPEGKARDSSVKGWTIARDENDHFYLDLMWSCGRTSFSDITVVEGKGCHSPVQSKLPKSLHFKDQETVYGKVVGWQKPVKEGYDKVKASLADIDSKVFSSKISEANKAQVLLLAGKARDNITKIEADGSWGVHGNRYSKRLINEAVIYVNQAKAVLGK